ncbi:MAG: hypothetical protein A2411_01720 [Candidatus Pacebacteria bacterium RIFOXYC1_FULL_39_21]|nr:MAG: hypothetical protein A2411_01720 [Candidatus Pacebacteria bacterium RIFOXYC1_FULL_39_21]
MINKLTDNKFWENYWQSKKVISPVLEKNSFTKIFKRELSNKKYKTMIEIGGFPGTYAIYFKKYWNYQSTLLDYVFDKRKFIKLLKINNLKEKDISVIIKDFFKFNDRKKYDLVFSLGFIEHFDDVEDVIKRHWRLVNRGGKLIIGIPNFLGINGLHQLLFDPANLNIHNLDAMNIFKIKVFMKRLNPRTYSVKYVSGKLVWLENIESRSNSVKLFTFFLNIIGMILTKLNINNKLTATHIFIVAEKK